MIYLENESYMLGKALHKAQKFAISSRHEYLTPDHLLWAIAEQEPFKRACVGYEIQEELAKMNVESLEINNLDDRFTVHNTRLQDIDNTFNNKFSLILCNPPYKRQNSGEKSELTSLAICKHEVTITLEEIIQIASKKLKYGGRLCICQRIERLNDCICLMRENKIEPNVLQFITTKEDGLPYLFLIEGTYGLKPQLKVLNNKVNG